MNQTNVKSTATLNNKEIKYLPNSKDGDEKIMTNLDKGRLDSVEAQEHNKTERSTENRTKLSFPKDAVKKIKGYTSGNEDAGKSHSATMVGHIKLNCHKRISSFANPTAFNSRRSFRWSVPGNIAHIKLPRHFKRSQLSGNDGISKKHLVKDPNAEKVSLVFTSYANIILWLWVRRILITCKNMRLVCFLVYLITNMQILNN